MKGPCKGCARQTRISISKLLQKERKYDFCNIPTAIYCNNCLSMSAEPVKPGAPLRFIDCTPSIWNCPPLFEPLQPLQPLQKL